MLLMSHTMSVTTPCCSRVLIDPWEKCCQLRDSRLSILFVFVILCEVSVTRHLAGPTP